MSRYLQRQYSDTPSREDYVSSVLRSLECGDRTSSRRLSRTLSTRAHPDGKPPSTLGTRNYLPLTRRSLSLLEPEEGARPSHRHLSSSASDKYNYNYRPLRSSSFLADRSYKSSSASDCGDYVGRSTADVLGDVLGGNVLPPLPYVLSSHRKGDPKRSYSQHFSSDIEHSGKKEQVGCTNTDSKHKNLLESELLLPEKTFTTKEDSISKHASSSLTGGFTLNSSPQKTLIATGNGTVPTSENEAIESKTCETNAADQCQKVTSSCAASQKNLSSSVANTGESQDNKHRSQIPSLLRFRSLSVCREVDAPKPRKDLLLTGALTPEKSILSKFFRQGSDDRSSSVVSGDKDKRKSGNSARRISRFLRPDFFDTPREESEYAKQKEAKKSAEAEEKALARKKKLMEKLDAVKKVSESNKVINSDITAKKINSSKKSQNVKKTETSGRDVCDKGEKKPIIKKVDVNGNGKEEKTEKKDTSVNDVNKKGDKAKSEAFVKQIGKNSFLHSLEKRLEKFCASGEGAVPTNVKNSRVDKAIRSLRESSVAPPSSATSITESNLLKRAVSADDCSSLSPNLPTGSSTSKVNSMLGLFRRLEGTSTPHNQSLKQRSKRPTSMIVDQVKRSQAAYTGSHSDSVLLSQPPVELEDEVQIKADNTEAKDASDTNVPAAERNKPGRTAIAAHNSSGKSKIVKNEHEIASSFLLNKTGTEKDDQCARKEPVRPTHSKSIPRPTNLKGLKDTAAETVTSVANHFVCSKEGGQPKQQVPEANSKLLQRRAGTNSHLDTAAVAITAQETVQQPYERSKCLEVPFRADDTPTLASPGDESGSQSFDSWSVSSDLEGRENLSSPIPPYSMSESIEESVGERIRRKSFYSRFNNTGKRSRKSSVPVLSSSYSSSSHDSANPSQSRKTPVRQSNSRTSGSRSQSLYAEDNLLSYGRKSPINNRGYYGQYSSDLVNNVGSVDVNDNLQNGFPMNKDDECNNLDYGRVAHLDGYYLGDYSPYTCRSAERRLSRPIDFIKDVRRSSSVLPGLYSSLHVPSSLSGCADSTTRYGLPEGEVCHLGKYSRYNSHSAGEPPSNAGSEDFPAGCVSEQAATSNN